MSAVSRSPEATAELVLGHIEGDAQVTVVHERSLTARMARSTSTQSTAVDALAVHVLSVVDGHTGSATCTSQDPEVLAATAVRARRAAEAAARSGPGTFAGLPVPAPTSPHDGFDAQTAELEPASAGSGLGDAAAVCAEHGLEAFGVWAAGSVHTAIVSSAGLAASDRVTDVFAKVVARDADGRSGYTSAAGVASAAVDMRGLAREAAAKVVPGEAASLPSGAWPVVLDADAVGLLLQWLGSLAFNGQSHAEGRGALTGRLGTRVAAATVTVSDAPRFASTLPRAFDAEGVAKARLTLIEDGVARDVVHDTRSATIAGDGAVSTGHATVAGGSSWGPEPTNLVLAGGDAADVAELAAPIERGLYVTRLWYVNPVHERSALVTGVTRDGTFLIEDGRITRPMHDVRFTDSALRILDATEALGASPRLTSEGEFYGTRFATGVVCPPLRAHGFRITGGAS